MNPLTFEQIVTAVSFLGMVLTLINGTKAMNCPSRYPSRCGRGCDPYTGGTAGTPRAGEYTLILI